MECGIQKQGTIKPNISKVIKLLVISVRQMEFMYFLQETTSRSQSTQKYYNKGWYKVMKTKQILLKQNY